MLLAELLLLFGNKDVSLFPALLECFVWLGKYFGSGHSEAGSVEEEDTRDLRDEEDKEEEQETRLKDKEDRAVSPRPPMFKELSLSVASLPSSSFSNKFLP